MVGMRSLRDRHGRTIWFQVWVLMLTQANRDPKEAGVAETWGSQPGRRWDLYLDPQVHTVPEGLGLPCVMPLPSSESQGPS